jgi:hypothetical protein
MIQSDDIIVLVLYDIIGGVLDGFDAHTSAVQSHHDHHIIHNQ